MVTLGVVVRPPIKRATIETINLLSSIKFDALFLDLPRYVECYLLDYLKHKNLEIFIDQISDNMSLEILSTSLIRGYEKFLEALCNIAHDKHVYCYGSVLKSKYESEMAFMITQLTLHDLISNKISIERWNDVLSLMMQNLHSWISEESEYIASEAENHDAAICITGYDGATLKKYLSKYFNCWLKYTGTPFHLPPLYTLIRINKIKNLSSDEIIKIIKEHLKFIHDFIIPFGLEDGLELWSIKKLYWLNPKQKSKDKN